jgi:hypothetical protein
MPFGTLCCFALTTGITANSTWEDNVVYGNTAETIATDKTCKLSASNLFVSEGQSTQQPTVTDVQTVTGSNEYRLLNGELEDINRDPLSILEE